MQPKDVPDQQVIDERVRAAQAGDSAAFSELLDTHYDLMYRFALKYTGEVRDAEDVTQQACMKLAKSIGQFRFESAFSTWLYRLVVNCAKDWYRAAKTAQVSGSDVLEGELYANEETMSLVAQFETQGEVQGQGEVQVQLRQVLTLVATLGEGFKEAVVLVLGEGLSHKEAALILGVKESTVSWRLHETKKRLAAMEVST